MKPDTITKALHGNREAQAECTRSGCALPCQCGGEAGRIVCNVLSEDSLHTENEYAAGCYVCGIRTRMYETYEEALGVWNARAELPANQED